MDDDMRSAAARAVIFSVLEQEAKKHKDAAKAELAQLQPGDTIGGSWDGQLLGKATMTTGRTKLVVTDEAKLLSWLQYNHPTEIVTSPNPAYLKALESLARDVGAVIDNQGEIVPGVELVHGDPYVSVRKEKDAPFVVAQLLSAGRVALDGIKEVEA
jgi:hypothetical protein